MSAEVEAMDDAPPSTATEEPPIPFVLDRDAFMQEMGGFDEMEKKTILDKVDADYEAECEKARKR